MFTICFTLFTSQQWRQHFFGRGGEFRWKIACSEALMYSYIVSCTPQYSERIPLDLYLLYYVKFSLWPCWLPDSPALEKHPAQSCVTAADWVSWSQDLCFLFDRRVWNSWVKSSLRWYLRRLLWWWFMTGIAFKWMKEFCWMSFLRRTSENCIKEIKIWTINITQIVLFITLDSLIDSS